MSAGGLPILPGPRFAGDLHTNFTLHFSLRAPSTALRTGLRLQRFQRRGQVNITVRDLEFFAEGLEFFNDRLGEFALEVGVGFAGEDSTAGKTMRVNSALATYLVTTTPPCHFLYIGAAEFVDEINYLRRGNEQTMAIRFEIAAFAAGVASTRQ